MIKFVKIRFTYSLLVILFAITVFLSGFVVIMNGGIKFSNSENMENNTNDEPDNPSSCPDLLIKENNKLTLLNTRMPKEDGVNPVVFDNLDQYTQYVNAKRANGIECPVLFFQQENDAQGNDVYRMRETPYYVEGGLPPIQMTLEPPNTNANPITVTDSSRENTPFNKNMYNGFDPQSLYIGRYTNIDEIHNSTSSGECSANASDTNWCGPYYSNEAIERGEYKNEEVGKVIYPQLRPR
jgi:hypothetical protein